MTPEQAVAYRTGSKDDTRKNPRKIGDEVIAQLVRLRGSMPVKELATLFGLGESTIHAILKRERDLAGKDGGNAQNV
ncbi:hypothetical protein [Paraburkholderia youngii]|uniref:hypothetical protein n=1 Tax=Paraburkholderia youngii TaxID=2782701 RepID=UPI003D239670